MTRRAKKMPHGAHQGLKVPKSLRIGALDISVITADTLEKDSWGLYRFGRSIELVNDFPTPIFGLDTFLHEIFHAIYDAWSLRKGDEEERVVSAMATGCTQVLRDNPELIKCIASVISNSSGSTRSRRT